MNIPMILASAVLGSVAVNALHWSRRKGERLLYYPGAGRLRILFVLWTAATGAAAVLFLANFIPAPIFLGIAFGLTIAHELYSIIRRQQQSAT